MYESIKNVLKRARLDKQSRLIEKLTIEKRLKEDLGRVSQEVVFLTNGIDDIDKVLEEAETKER